MKVVKLEGEISDDFITLGTVGGRSLTMQVEDPAMVGKAVIRMVKEAQEAGQTSEAGAEPVGSTTQDRFEDPHLSPGDDEEGNLLDDPVIGAVATGLLNLLSSASTNSRKA